jgi:uncharacterized protein (TIGR02599 family)
MSELGPFGFKRHSVRAFTLAEMLVAIALLVILSTLLFGVVYQTNNVWQQGSSLINSRQRARNIFDFMQRDISSAALPADRSQTNSLQFVTSPSQLDSSYQNPHSIFFQAPVATDTTYGDVAEVGYFVRWDTSNAANPRGVLCRYFVNPENPTATVNFLIYSNPAAWLTDALINTVAPGVVDKVDSANSYRGWMADDVIALWVRCLDSDGNPILKNGKAVSYAPAYSFDSRLGYLYTGPKGNIIKTGYQDATVSGRPYKVLCTLPRMVEIALVLLDAPSAGHLTAKPAAAAITSPPTAGSFAADIKAYVQKLPSGVRTGARIYTIRIPLKNAD